MVWVVGFDDDSYWFPIACSVGGVFTIHLALNALSLIAEVSRESCLCVALPVALIACGVGG